MGLGMVFVWRRGLFNQKKMGDLWRFHYSHLSNILIFKITFPAWETKDLVGSVAFSGILFEMSFPKLRA